MEKGQQDGSRNQQCEKVEVFHMAVSYFEHKATSYMANTCLLGALTQYVVLGDN